MSVSSLNGLSYSSHTANGGGGFPFIIARGFQQV